MPCTPRPLLDDGDMEGKTGVCVVDDDVRDVVRFAMVFLKTTCDGLPQNYLFVFFCFSPFFDF